VYIKPGNFLMGVNEAHKF